MVELDLPGRGTRSAARINAIRARKRSRREFRQESSSRRNQLLAASESDIAVIARHGFPSLRGCPCTFVGSFPCALDWHAACMVGGARDFATDDCVLTSARHGGRLCLGVRRLSDRSDAGTSASTARVCGVPQRHRLPRPPWASDRAEARLRKLPRAFLCRRSGVGAALRSRLLWTAVRRARRARVGESFRCDTPRASWL